MSAGRKSQRLPSPVRALWFACRCFDIQAKDVGFSPMALSRACAGVGIKPETLEEVRNRLMTSLYERFRTREAPGSHANSITDTFFSVLLTVYERLSAKVDPR